MATREWSQAEREKAAEQLHLRRVSKWIDNPEMKSLAAHNGYVNDLQCEVNFLRAQIEEARELLSCAVDELGLKSNCDYLVLPAEIWLDRNPRNPETPKPSSFPLTGN